MTLGLIEITANHPSIVSAIKSTINVNPNKLINLMQLSEDHAEIDTVMNSIFNSRFSDFNNGSWKNYIANNYHYDTTYIPFIRLANVDTSNLIMTLPALVAAPLEINEEAFPELVDHVPIWYKRANGTTYLSTINETTIANISAPVLVINNGFEGDELRGNTMFTPANPHIDMGEVVELQFHHLIEV